MSKGPQDFLKDFSPLKKEEAAIAGSSRSWPARCLRGSHSTEAEGLEKKMKAQVSPFSRKEAHCSFPYPAFIKHLLSTGCSTGGGEQGSCKHDSSLGSLPEATTSTGVNNFLCERLQSKYSAFTGQRAYGATSQLCRDSVEAIIAHE